MRYQLSISVIALVIVCAAAPAHAQLVATPYIDTNVAGDVETGRGGIGASVGYYVHGVLGFELDVERHGHFFNDEDVADLVPDKGVDLDTDATLFMGNLVVPYRIQGAFGIWSPYAAAGGGLIRATFDGVVFDGGADQDEYDSVQNDLALHVGAGVMHALTDLVGVRIDVRYFRAFVDENAKGYDRDYDFWRVSVGATFGFPR